MLPLVLRVDCPHDLDFPLLIDVNNFLHQKQKFMNIYQFIFKFMNMNIHQFILSLSYVFESSSQWYCESVGLH